MPSSLKKRHRRILQGSILLSLLLHIAQVHFLQNRPLWFAKTSLQMSTKRLGIEKYQKEQILKQTFHTMTVQKNTSPKHIPIEPDLLFKENFPVPSLEQAVFEYSTESLDFTAKSLEIPLPSQESFPSLFPKCPLTKKIPEKPSLEVAKPLAVSLDLKDPEFKPTLPQYLIENQDLDEKISENSVSETKNLDLKTEFTSFLPSLYDLNTYSLSDYFDIELTFSKSDDSDYVFALTLIPKSELNTQQLQQNYLFYIDRSNSIQRERLNATKNAISKAIKELSPIDRFNIIVFDQKIDKLSADFLPVNAESFNKAQRFLEKIELGSFFSQTNLYNPLFLSIPRQSSIDQTHTAILFTDGEIFSKKNIAKNLIFDWSFANQGKVSFYALSMQEDRYVDALQTMAFLNRGKIITSTTQRGLKRKLLKLMKSIHSPIAKNLSFQAVAQAPNVKIEFFPKNTNTPLLFANEPLVLFGTSNSLEDFTLFIQGTIDGKWLHIKKTISFANSKKGGSNLQTECAIQKISSLYFDFIQSQDEQYLIQANELIETYHLDSISWN